MPIMAQQGDLENEEIGKLTIRLSNAMVLPMVLRSALKLNLIDILISRSTNDGGCSFFLSPSEIAARLPTSHPNTPVLLDRMLRLLSSYDILKCSLRTRDNGEIERLYGAGTICKFLVSNKSGEGSSLAPFFMLENDEILLKSWDYLDESVLEGGIPFDRAHGMTIFEYLGTDQRFKRVFNEAMSGHSTLVVNKMLNIYEGFEGVQVLVDVGGGIGSTLDSITSKHPHIKGINYDLPRVLVDAPSYTGVEHVGGDMFANVPKGDAIFLKCILHDWNDEDCLKLLKNCWEALPDNGKVIIVEMILPVDPENIVSSHIAFELDMLMLAQTPGGKERTLKEFEALAIKSGFMACEVICSAFNYLVIEFHKMTIFEFNPN